jgi:hypothetical protein
MVIKYSKWPQNIPTFSIPKPFKIYPNKDFWVWKYTIWQPWTGDDKIFYLTLEETNFRTMTNLEQQPIKIGCSLGKRGEKLHHFYFISSEK